MADQWNDSAFAINWDQTAVVGNPTRIEQLDILAALIERLYQPGTAILDLGSGSGLVEDLLFTRVPESYVVGVEASPPMIELAKQRLAPFGERYTLVRHDLADAQGLILPAHTYQIAISVQSLHHLAQQQQREIYRFVYRTLVPEGVFLLLDRVALDIKRFGKLYRPMWDRLERESTIKSGWGSDLFFARLQGKDDFPGTCEEQLGWLREAGFQAVCLHMHLNRALVAGVKG